MNKIAILPFTDEIAEPVKARVIEMNTHLFSTTRALLGKCPKFQWDLTTVKHVNYTWDRYRVRDASLQKIRIEESALCSRRHQLPLVLIPFRKEHYKATWAVIRPSFFTRHGTAKQVSNPSLRSVFCWNMGKQLIIS